MIRVAVVGYGYWGPNLVRNFMEQPGCEVAAVCDARPERLELAARRCPAARTTRQVEDVMDDPAVDAVVVATPVATHFELARRALEAGKHVFVEKPIATSTREADELIERAALAKRVLQVDHTFVYTGAVRMIRELVAAGELGDILYYDSVRINLGLFQHDVNVLWDLAVHDLSILDYVLGSQVVSVAALGFRHLSEQPENLAYLTLRLKSGAVAHIHVNWLAPVKIRRTVIGGTRRMVVYDDIEPSDKLKIYDSGADLVRDEASVHKILVSYRVGEMRAPRLDLGEALHVEAQHFLACVREGATPITDGRAGCRVVAILEAAERSMADDGRMVELVTNVPDTFVTRGRGR
jgi:predicted dehydrogenase